ncbi:response regulator, partial [Candidatus Sumerlaeota bacterium]|nr:response regulator [Candidatus Sumerlaeota bacterium]
MALKFFQPTARPTIWKIHPLWGYSTGLPPDCKFELCFSPSLVAEAGDFLLYILTMSTHRSVLLIDDDPDLREMVSIALGSEGFTIHQAENGKQGLEMLADCEPDIILLDMMMPEMNGIEFCRALTDGVDEVDVPVLVMSAVNEKAKTLRDFQEMNITTKGFLHKPFDLRELISRVKAMIGDVPPASEKPAESPPAKPAEPVESARARLSPTVANGPRVRILLVDDDPDILDAMQITLGTQFDVRTAPNGAEALSQIESFDPDFIISDIEMPVLDGLKMVERLRRDPRFGGLPVFFLSGMEGTNLPRKTFNVGGNLFLRKPMEPQRLLKIIEHFIAETGIKPRPAGVERRAAAAQPVTRQPA